MIAADTLASALKLADKVVERRSSLPILTNVRLRATNGELEITATDLDTELVTRLPYGGEPVDTTVGAAQLLQIAQQGGDASLELSQADGKLRIDGAARFTLYTLPAEDFPVMTDPEPSTSFEMPPLALLSALSASAVAVSTEETRYYLNGVYIQRLGEQLGFTATDGHRLAMVRMPAPEGTDGLQGSIVHRDVVKLLRHMLEETPAAVKMGFSASKVRFEIGRSVITSKLIYGTFPDYPRIVPKDFKGTIVLPAEQLLAGCRAAGCLTTEKVRPLQLFTSPARIEAKHPEGGKVEAELAAEIEGEPPEFVSFNARYFEEIVQQRPFGDVKLSLSDAASPVLVEFEKDPSFSAVLMPMRVR